MNLPRGVYEGSIEAVLPWTELYNMFSPFCIFFVSTGRHHGQCERAVALFSECLDSVARIDALNSSYANVVLVFLQAHTRPEAGWEVGTHRPLREHSRVSHHSAKDNRLAGPSRARWLGRCSLVIVGEMC